MKGVVTILCLLLSLGVQGQITFLFSSSSSDKSYNESVYRNNTIVYGLGDGIMIRVTFDGATGNCSSLCTLSLIGGPNGDVSLYGDPGTSVVLEGSGDLLIEVEVLWCAAPSLSPPGSTANMRGWERAALTDAVFTQGPCSPDARVALAQPLSNMTDIALGEWHGVALGGDGHVYAWGSNDLCQLGQGVPADMTPYARQVPLISGAVSPLMARGGVSCVRARYGGGSFLSLVCFGMFFEPFETIDNCTNYDQAWTVSGALSAQATFAISDATVALYDPPTLYVVGASATLILPRILSLGSNNFVRSYYLIATTQLLPGWSALGLSSVGDQFLLLSNTTSQVALLGTCTGSTTLGSSVGNVPGCLLSTSTYCNASLPSVNFDGSLQCGGVCTLLYGSLDPRCLNYVGVSPTSFSFTASSVCGTGNGSGYCVGQNTAGQIPYAPFSFATSNFSWAPGGGRIILKAVTTDIGSCVLLWGGGLQGLVQCGGSRTLQFGVSLYYTDPATGMVADLSVCGPVPLSAPTPLHVLLSGPMGVPLSSGYLGVSAPMGPGCFSPLYVGGTEVAVATPYPRAFPWAGGCIYTLNCASSTWAIDAYDDTRPGGPVVTGDHHACILTGSPGNTTGVACTGLTVGTPYIPLGHADAREFNPVDTGGMSAVDSVYANDGNATCILSGDKTALLCQGTFGVYTIADIGPGTVRNLPIGHTVAGVYMGDNAVCYTDLETATGLYRAYCMGDNGNGFFAPASTGLTWTELADFGAGVPVRDVGQPALGFQFLRAHPGCMFVLMAPYNVLVNRACALATGDSFLGDQWFAVHMTLLSAPVTVLGTYMPLVLEIGITQILMRYVGSGALVLFSTSVHTYSGNTPIPYTGHDLPLLLNTTLVLSDAFAGIYTPSTSVSSWSEGGLASGRPFLYVVDTLGRLCCSGNNSLGQCSRLFTNASTWLGLFVCVTPSLSDGWPYLSAVGPNVSVSDDDSGPPGVPSTVEYLLIVGSGILLMLVLSMAITCGYRSYLSFKREDAEVRLLQGDLSALPVSS